MRSTILTAHAIGVCLAFLACASPAATFVPAQVQKLLATDGQMFDQLGNSAAIDGSTIVVGAPSDDGQKGAAYVYTLSSGTWNQQQKLTASDGAGLDYFGTSVAISGDTVLVGAQGDEANRGAAYVFTRSGSDWTQQQKLTASLDPSDTFGRSVALVGDVALIGAPIDNDDKGRAYIFTRSGGVWTQQAVLEASDGAVNDRFGWSVDMTSDTIVIGAHFANLSTGAAYVFTGSGSSWTEQQKLIASDGTEADSFGSAVAVYGNTAIVGASGEDDRGTDSGAAYVFTRAGSAWTQQQKLTPDDGSSKHYLGDSVAVCGDVVAVGAVGFNLDGGAVYLYTRSGGIWSQQAQLATPSDAGSSPAYLFGWSTALVDNTLVVGMPGDSWFRGAAYVFSLPQTADVTPPQVTAVTVDDVAYPADPVLTAIATDVDSNIESADYSLEGGTWTSMEATNGGFDEKSEGLKATIAGPLSVDSYTVCVRATDSETNESSGEDCDTFAVTAATMTVTFGGEYLDLNGSPTMLKATVSGPDACTVNAQVDFYDGDLKLNTAAVYTNESGYVELSIPLLYGVHDLRVVVPDRGFDPDETAECAGDSDAGSAVVADPNAASSGGGWYKVPLFYDVSPPRVNFGYVANVKFNKKTQEFVTTGNLLWMNQDNFKLKGAIDQSGKFECPTSDYVACAGFAGTGILYEHNDSYEPGIGDPSEEWAGNSPLEVSFEVRVYDGGSSTVCQKKRCTVTERPDAIMMQIHGASVPAAPYEILTLQGGGITVKK